jgi:hypothetical protein
MSYYDDFQVFVIAVILTTGIMRAHCKGQKKEYENSADFWSYWRHGVRFSNERSRHGNYYRKRGSVPEMEKGSENPGIFIEKS